MCVSSCVGYENASNVVSTFACFFLAVSNIEVTHLCNAALAKTIISNARRADRIRRERTPGPVIHCFRVQFRAGRGCVLVHVADGGGCLGRLRNEQGGLMLGQLLIKHIVQNRCACVCNLCAGNRCALDLT